jgi:hypothetical protein
MWENMQKQNLIKAQNMMYSLQKEVAECLNLQYHREKVVAHKWMYVIQQKSWTSYSKEDSSGKRFYLIARIIRNGMSGSTIMKK